MYSREDLSWYNYAVRNKKTVEPIASFGFYLMQKISLKSTEKAQ